MGALKGGVPRPMCLGYQVQEKGTWWGGGDEKAVRSAVWGSNWLILQAHISSRPYGRDMYLECAPYLSGPLTRRGGMGRGQFSQSTARKSSPVARAWQHLVWGDAEVLCTRG